MAAKRIPAEPQRTSVDGQRSGVAYFRVSTLDQANTSYDDDGFSIQAQRDYCQRKAAELGVELVDEYIDRGKSARTADRPALQAMLTRLKDDTDIQYVFVHKLDRLARNREDDVQIGLLLAKHGVRLVSCTENIDDSPSGKLVHGIMADIAEWYSANLSEEAKKGMRKKVEIGGTPGRAPLGYLNTRVKITALGKDIGVVQVHDTYAPMITECFRLYDTGLCTLADVVDYANDQGLRLPADKRLPERPVSVQHMHRILRNRYYAGWVQFGGVAYKGEHPPLVDPATFDRVQALLTARDTNRDKSHKRPHHLKGTLYCARCGRRLGITVSQGRRTGDAYPYFYCLGRQHDKTSCPQGYVAVGDVEAAVRAFWSRMRLPTERIAALRAEILASFTGKHEQGQAEIAKQQRRLLELEQRRKKAKAAYYADALGLDEFKTEQEAIRHGVAAAEATIAKWTVELESITASLDEALRLMEQPQALYDALPEGLKVQLVQAVFEKLWILDNRVVGSDLRQTFAELLTVEARVAIDSQQADSGLDPSVGSSTATYHRDRTTELGPLPSGASLQGFLRVERPQGLLGIDSKNLHPQRGRGSKIHHLVGVRGFNLNRELAAFIKEHSGKFTSEPTMPRSSRRWRVRDRLDERDLVRLVIAYRTGIATKELAERYGINVKSVRKLLREERARRQSRKGTEHT